MKIKGLQKTTLIDYPKKIACTIFLFGCNFRCGFCHNPDLVLKEVSEDILKEDVLDFLEKRKGLLEGVCITGGEPLLTLEKNFAKKIKEKNFLIKLDTNGSLPEKLKEFVDEKLIDFVAMDVKSSKEKYEEVVGVNVNLNKINESIKIILGLKEYEFRTTILESIHTKEDVRKMILWLYDLNSGKKIKKFCLQGFKNSGKLIDFTFSKEKNTSEEYLKDLKKIIEPYCDKVLVRV